MQQQTKAKPRIDLCPGCKTPYQYDEKLDCWENNIHHPIEKLYDPFKGCEGEEDREVILAVCPRCNCVIGICVLDKLGGTCYVSQVKMN